MSARWTPADDAALDVWVSWEQHVASIVRDDNVTSSAPAEKPKPDPHEFPRFIVTLAGFAAVGIGIFVGIGYLMGRAS